MKSIFTFLLAALALAANIPVAGETGIWNIIAGSSTSLNANSNPISTFSKETVNTYNMVGNINDVYIIPTDTLNLLLSAPVDTTCGQTVTYFEESYPTVQIGNQCWFAKNLNVGTMINGSIDQMNNGTMEKYCYNNDPVNCTVYGGLYQWAEAVQYQNGASKTAKLPTAFIGNVRGICPAGWHLPSDAEYCTLKTFLGGTLNCGTHNETSGGKMKSVSSLWNYPNTGATNSSGFSALPGGRFQSFEAFNNIGNLASFWSSSEDSDCKGINHGLIFNGSFHFQDDGRKENGFSVRCIQD